MQRLTTEQQGSGSTDHARRQATAAVGRRGGATKARMAAARWGTLAAHGPVAERALARWKQSHLKIGEKLHYTTIPRADRTSIDGKWATHKSKYETSMSTSLYLGMLQVPRLQLRGSPQIAFSALRLPSCPEQNCPFVLIKGAVAVGLASPPPRLSPGRPGPPPLCSRLQ